MENKEIENKIYQAYTNVPKDSLDSIMEELEDIKVESIPTRKEARRPSFLPRLALAFVLLIGIFFSSTYQSQRVTSTVSLDVNPSIQIQLNNKNKVLEVLAQNEDAEVILDGMDFKGSDLKVTMNALIGSLVRHGYLSEMNNSILVSVENENSEKAVSLEKELLEEIDSLLDYQGSILTQTISENQTLQEAANTYGITMGKAQLIQELVDENALYTYEELAPLTIHELNLLKKEPETSKIQRNGKPSEKGYLGEDKAKEIALKDTGLNENDVMMKKVELDYEHHRLVYEVEFYHGGKEYEYDIDAKTGEIVDVDVDYEEDHIYSQPSSTPSQSDPTNVDFQTAKQIALNHAGLQENQVYDLEVEIDGNVYEVEFKANGYEYDYEIAIDTGAIVKSKKEWDD